MLTPHSALLRYFLPKPMTPWTAAEGVLQANIALSSFSSLALTPGGLDVHEDLKKRICQEELCKPCRKSVPAWRVKGKGNTMGL